MNPGCAHYAARCKIKPDRQDWLCPDRVTFFLAEVTTARLNVLSELFDASKLQPQVGSVRPVDRSQAIPRNISRISTRPRKNCSPANHHNESLAEEKYRPWQANPFRIRTYQKSACNSFRFRTYEKHPRGCPRSFSPFPATSRPCYSQFVARKQGADPMEWTTPTHEEIDLSCEISSYANAEL
jgi:hypothetical protein